LIWLHGTDILTFVFLCAFVHSFHSDLGGSSSAFHKLFIANPTELDILYLADTSVDGKPSTFDGWRLRHVTDPPIAFMNLILAAIPVSHIPRMPNAESQQKPTGHMNQPESGKLITRISTSTCEYVCMSEHIKIWPEVSALFKKRHYLLFRIEIGC